ncbi:MAG: hypothetical protein C3F17_14845 [Bradyrhizobiaceae bacterium]|nr:MAG: hypothetical protein C3F17_14845 [Bradyrhizobiaceae bacterium]
MSSRARTGEKARKRASTARKTSPQRRTLIRVKRAYDPPEAEDGIRILIDRLWPRGVTKAKLAADAWPRELTPSTALRKWYRHDAAQFPEFRRRYLAELAGHEEALAELRKLVRGKRATLVTATRALDCSHAQVLREVLAGKARAGSVRS